FKRLLNQREIPYVITPRLVRGLDYYMRTAFEIVGERLGAQNTIVGGGRYDGLSELIGGSPAKGFGFALGLERLVMTMPEDRVDLKKSSPFIYVAYIGESARDYAFALARKLRGAGISTVVDLEGRKLKKSLAIANTLNAKYTIIIGEDEIKKGAFVLRDMTSGDQRDLKETDILTELKDLPGSDV
ncbi:MAG: His/Gly/Thr/Pro-type tRNA ligase C-terminal domain-containing protein, partial [Blastocatellia bacterium]